MGIEEEQARGLREIPASIFGRVDTAGGDLDRCCVCGLELDLSEMHDFDREKGAPKHRGC